MLELFTTDWRELWQGTASQEPVGAVFTKPEIVELILDLAGYSPSGRLATRPLLEPSCGDGAFLRAVVDRLLQSEKAYNGIQWADTLLDDAIRAADINAASIESARSLVTAQLRDAGCPAPRASRLAERWIIQTDFLLSDWPIQFEFVIGNPPYVRLEDVPRRVLMRYRELFRTATDRADLYVAFFEKGLRLLSTTGTLAFICANRFTKNKYGEALRRLMAKEYHVRYYINLEHTQPFLTDVSAYPAIIVLDRAKGEPTRAATLKNIELPTIRTVRSESLGTRRPKRAVAQFEAWYPHGEPWLTTCDEEHDLLAQLNGSLPVLEESAPRTRVGIGVATGADKVFVLEEKHSAIEDSRQLPLLMAADVSNEALRWSGHYLLNPFADEDDGSLVRLRDYPGFARYIEEHTAKLKARHCAKSRPDSWYRTIDRIWPSLRLRPKLMIPDIQLNTTVGLDEGQYYPHHNLYWITSESWPLPSLKALLRSSIVFQQVRAYSVQMRGGSVRFQAQTLRRLRLPALATVPDPLLERLADLAQTDRQDEIDEAARKAFTLRR
jgi:hypothetical protein